MEFTKISSLQRMTFTKVTLALWNENDVKNLVADYRPPLSMKKRKEKMLKWLKLENEVRAKVSKLPIPELLKKKLSHFISPIGLEMDIVHSNTHLLTNGLSGIFWTPLGTIDIKKMGEQLMQDEDIDSIHRFQVACTFCLENYVYDLWQQLPEDSYRNITSVRSDERVSLLVSFWSHSLGGKIAIFDNIRKRYYDNNDLTLYEFLFWFSAEEGNELACRHFYRKLTSEEKEKILVKTAIHVAKKSCSPMVKSDGHHTNVLFFLFSVMNEEQQIEVFKCELRSILSCLFEWPWHDLFLKMSRQMWFVLIPEDYFYLLTTIREKIICRDKDYDYQMLFGVIWQQIPNAFKKDIVNRCIGRSTFVKLFEIKDKANIKMFLRDAVISIEGIFFNNKGRRIYESLIHYNLWDMFRFFIEKCSLSRDSLIKFREKLKKNILMKIGKGQNFVLDKPIEIINQLIQKCNKRSSDEEKGHPLKKRGSVKFVKGRRQA